MLTVCSLSAFTTHTQYVMIDLYICSALCPNQLFAGKCFTIGNFSLSNRYLVWDQGVLTFFSIVRSFVDVFVLYEQSPDIYVPIKFSLFEHTCGSNYLVNLLFYLKCNRARISFCNRCFICRLTANKSNAIDKQCGISINSERLKSFPEIEERKFRHMYNTYINFHFPSFCWHNRDEYQYITFN